MLWAYRCCLRWLAACSSRCRSLLLQSWCSVSSIWYQKWQLLHCKRIPNHFLLGTLFCSEPQIFIPPLEERKSPSLRSCSSEALRLDICNNKKKHSLKTVQKTFQKYVFKNPLNAMWFAYSLSIVWIDLHIKWERIVLVFVIHNSEDTKFSCHLRLILNNDIFHSLFAN